jgi:protein-S-isoprenylcysteine O-methyltransferase Ste14
MFPNLLFTLGRAFTGPAQYLLISAHPLARFGVPPPPAGSPPITLLGYTFPRLPFLAALMPAVVSAKHMFWLNFIGRERMTTSSAFFAVVSDFVYEAITSLVFTTASINPMFSEHYFYTGTTIYMASVMIELLAELQRSAFKAKAENEGEVCEAGFWGITRHINYTANVMFGFGYGLATGGPLYSVATAGLYISNFVLNAIPGIEKYCHEKYDDRWAEYELDVPWRLIPGIY